jgi:M3 family oligoendopeptidase
MKLEEIKYERFDINQIENEISDLITQMSSAKSYEKAKECFLRINRLRDNTETTMNLVRVRFSQDTRDEFYKLENDYVDSVSPLYDGIVHKYYQAITGTDFLDDFKKEFGEQLFVLAELQLKTFNESILEELKYENQLCSQYQQLSGSAEFNFDGQQMSMSQMGGYITSDDRETRVASRKLVMSFYEKNEAKYDEIYHNLVQVRTDIAKKLGYDNYVQLGYDRYARSDYNAKDVKRFREAVFNHVVPVATSLAERQKNRLGLESLDFIDDVLLFKTGNARPAGNPDWIVEQGNKVFSSLSEDASTCYNKMQDAGLLDLVARKGKSGGGYCEYLNTYQMPFIFSNFNGTSGDIDILTHEFGHAFQVYQTRDFVIPEYHWPTSEACEVHSTSMEFLTWEKMHEFFGEDDEKYRFTHLSTSVAFIPYITTVDEFQHYVYENPEVTPKERKDMWRTIEKKYMPSKDYSDYDFYNRGGTFFRQSHIFTIPFYYIEYALAKVCAYQLWADSRDDFDETWKRYIELCQLGGTKSFLSLLKEVDIDSPFDPKTIEQVMPKILSYLNKIDDAKL